MDNARLDNIMAKVTFRGRSVRAFKNRGVRIATGHSVYTPHQGARERARRIRQMAKAGA